MKLVYNDNFCELYNGNMLDMISSGHIKPMSIDCIVTDPPYELNFMGKSWDNQGVSFQKETWKVCYDVLKPGGYLLAFGGSRTFHRIACAIEDAGFEIRDTIMWIYGCLSEDTEVLTEAGFKTLNDINEEDVIRVYDIKNGVYKWEKPERWNVYKVNEDTCYRIKSDCTDQLVSKNHRCLVEREGELVFKFAEDLCGMETVPVLWDDISILQKGQECVLFKDMQWQNENISKKLFSEWKRYKESEEVKVWGKESIMERWVDLSEQERELYKAEYKVCKVSEGVHFNGEERWICDGAQVTCSERDRETFVQDGSCAPYKSQCGGQQIGESNVVFNEQGAQNVRGWKSYRTTLATITKEIYTGIIYCPTVSTGCFVARRNGKVFITGNSGFPKSMNIGLAIDKKNGVESEVIGISNNGAGASPQKLNNHEHGDTGIGMLDGSGRTFEIKKAQNEWQGWGTCLKPSYEPIIIARKPFDGSLVDNVLKYGVGGLNIDECRIPLEDSYVYKETNRVGRDSASVFSEESCGYDNSKNTVASANPSGRFPANLILTYDESDYEEVCGGFPITKSTGGSGEASKINNFSNVYNGGWGHDKDCAHLGGLGDEGSASRYFYCAKASKKDREDGCELLYDSYFVLNDEVPSEIKNQIKTLLNQ